MAQAKGIRNHQYLDDWLLRAPCQATCLQHTRTLLALCHELGNKLREIRTKLAASFQFRWLPVRPFDRSGLAHSGPVVFPAEEAQVHQGAKLLYSQTVHVPNRSSHSDKETSMVRSPSHEAHPVAPKATLACPRKSGKGHFLAPFSSSTSRLVVKPEKRASGPAFTPSSACSANVYRHLKRRLGRSLRGTQLQEAFGHKQKVSST